MLTAGLGKPSMATEPMATKTDIQFPSAQQIEIAVRRYLDKAYNSRPPEELVRTFCPPGQGDLPNWLMGEEVERYPEQADLDEVRCFAFRMGNSRYRYMKMKISRPPGRNFFVFTVDAHDQILQAPPGSTDEAELADLKRYNLQLVQEIMDDWDHRGVFTERVYLRQEIEQARNRLDGKQQ